MDKYYNNSAHNSYKISQEAVNSANKLETDQELIEIFDEIAVAAKTGAFSVVHTLSAGPLNKPHLIHVLTVVLGYRVVDDTTAGQLKIDWANPAEVGPQSTDAGYPYNARHPYY